MNFLIHRSHLNNNHFIYRWNRIFGFKCFFWNCWCRRRFYYFKRFKPVETIKILQCIFGLINQPTTAITILKNSREKKALKFEMTNHILLFLYVCCDNLFSMLAHSFLFFQIVLYIKLFVQRNNKKIVMRIYTKKKLLIAWLGVIKFNCYSTSNGLID